MIYGFEAMIPTGNEVISQLKVIFDPKNNDQLLATNLDLLEEARELTRIRVMTYQ